MKKEQDIVTYENNIGFFAASKNSEPLIKQMEERIAKAKEELKDLEMQIRAFDNEGSQEQHLQNTLKEECAVWKSFASAAHVLLGYK